MLWSSYTNVSKPVRSKLHRVQDVPCIKDHRLFQERLDAIDIRALEHVPLGDDQEAISTCKGLVSIIRIVYVIVEYFAGILYAFGIECSDCYPIFEQGIDDINGR